MDLFCKENKLNGFTSSPAAKHVRGREVSGEQPVTCSSGMIPPNPTKARDEIWTANVIIMNG